MSRAPAVRGLTLSEDRALKFERVALYMVLTVSVIAAALSFVALSWFALEMGVERGAHYLLPLAIDGFAIACSVGIVVAHGNPLQRDRARFEWGGLILAVVLSVIGNVFHALRLGSGELPAWAVVPMAAAVPVIVAFGVHVYVRALGRGVSSRIMRDDPDHIRDETPARTQPPRPPSARPPRPASSSARATEPGAPAAPGAPTGARAEKGEAKERVYIDEYAVRLDAARTAGGDWTQAEMQGGDIAELLGCHKGSARKIRQTWRVRYEQERGVQFEAPAAPEAAPQAAAEQSPEPVGDLVAVGASSPEGNRS